MTTYQTGIDENIDLPTPLFEAMEQIAKETNRSLSAVYRVALRQYIASRDKTEVAE